MSVDLSAAPRSILSPLLMALTDVDPNSCSIAWSAARGAVPATSVRIGVLMGRKVESVVHVRQVLTSILDDGHSLHARLCDRAPGQSLSDSYDEYQWAVLARVLPTAAAAELLPGATLAVQLEVTRYRVQHGRVAGGAELALFRHQFACGLSALATSVAAIGGQSGWDDAWAASLGV